MQHFLDDQSATVRRVPRRLVLRAGALLGAGTALAASVPTIALAKGNDFAARRRAVLAAGERARRRVSPGWRSANGFLAETRADSGGEVWTREVSGTPLTLALRDGDARTLLEYAVRRFHYEVAELGPDDASGFLADAPRRGAWSNQASGTSVRLLPGRYPVGAEDGLFGYQVDVVRDILANCEKQLGWGGDLSPRCEGYFYVVGKQGDGNLRKAGQARRARESSPGHKAGALRLGA
ncbi:MAG: hypothetical protein ACRYG2_12915 [Janthinobacterium lividum]